MLDSFGREGWLKRSRPYLLFLLGFGVIYLSMDASAAIYETYGIVCENVPVHYHCPSIGTKLVFLRLVAAVCGVSLPFTIYAVLNWSDRLLANQRARTE
jgi:hypothetical protein